jgi:hypothetical protein
MNILAAIKREQRKRENRRPTFRDNSADYKRQPRPSATLRAANLTGPRGESCRRREGRGFRQP